MFKKIVSTTLISGMLFMPLVGCSKNYKVHNDNLAKRELYLNSSKKESMRYAMQALERIVNSFEKVAYEKRLEAIMEGYQDNKESQNDDKSASMFKYTAYTNGKVTGTYEVADFTVAFVKMNDNLIKYMIRRDIAQMETDLARIKKDVVREFVPVFQSITEQMIVAGNPPKTWMDVASEFVKHVPMLATMGAFYKLADTAIASAGNTINASLSDNAQLNNNNIKGNGNATDGSSIIGDNSGNTEAASEEAATEESTEESSEVTTEE